MHTDFSNAMHASGLICLEPIIADGEIHRFANGGKGKKNGWYILSPNGGAYGDWKLNIKGKWFPHYFHEMPPEAKQLIQQKTAEAKKERQEAIVRRQEEVAKQAIDTWVKLLEMGESPYLERKGIKGCNIRFDGKILVVPLRDIDDKLWNLQKIYPDGTKRFLAGGKKKGLFHNMGGFPKDQLLYLCEGYATGESIHKATGKPVVVCFDAGNLDSVIAAIKSKYPEVTLIIAADNDQWSEVNIGRKKAEEAALKHNCRVMFPKFLEFIESKPTDFNDLHTLAGLEEVKKQLALEIKELPTVKLPSGFSLSKEGLCFDKGDGQLEWVCSPIEVVSYTRDISNENWGRLIRFKDLDGYQHECAIPMDLLSGDCSELYGLLLSLGLRITTKKTFRNKLVDYLQNIKLDKRAVCTSRIGWHDNHFILPDGAIPMTDEVYLQSENGNYVGFRTAGTLKEWQESIAIPCQENSRLVFALSCAFAAPLLPLLNQESGGFNFKGGSSIGKSTALSVAASVWGSPQYIQQWKATGNALEAVAEAHNHALLCLDELGQVDGREAGEIAYMLANGSGKNRLKAKGGLRKKFEWNLLFLSTGEISIADKINEVGKKAQAGILARMVDVPADSGKGYRLFDTIHDFKDGNALANHFKQHVAKHYGTAIRAFLPFLPDIKEQLPGVIKQIEEDFFTQYICQNADGQVRRIAQRFVIVAAAGELAIKLGILPYSVGEALSAIGICFEAWLEARGNIGAYEVEEAIRQVRDFIEVHHSSRFALLDRRDEKVINQAGYKRKLENDQYDFFINPGTFNKEVCKGYDIQMVKKELATRNMLVQDKGGKYVVSTHVPALGKKKRMVHITSAIFTEEE